MKLRDEFSDYNKYFHDECSNCKLRGYFNKSNNDFVILSLGTNSLIISDGKTKILIDPYLSRFRFIFGLAYLLKSYNPRKMRINRILRNIGLKSADALFLTHTHPDHAIDAPYIAQKTGAVVYGSKSAANIARGWGISQEQIRIVENPEIYKIGEFSIKFIRSRHQPFPKILQPFVGLGEEIEKPLEYPAKPVEYKEGGSFCIHLDHPKGKLLVCGSPGFVKGMFDDIDADVMIAPVGGLKMQSRRYIQQFFREVIVNSGAKNIHLSHWDDFRVPIRKKQRFIRKSHEPAEKMIKKGKNLGITIDLLPMMEIIKPFDR